MKRNTCKFLLTVLILSAVTQLGSAQTLVVPDWALPGSSTHKQVSPPSDFHRPTVTSNIPIGIFEGQSDVGAALAPGSSSYDLATKQYTITSAGYNVWYVRDEFRYLWKKMSGDVSLAADIRYPDSLGFGDRKAVLVIRQSLDDDSKEALVALHGAGMMCIWHGVQRWVFASKTWSFESAVAVVFLAVSLQMSLSSPTPSASASKNAVILLLFSCA